MSRDITKGWNRPKSKEKKYWLEKLSGELTRSVFPYDYAQGPSDQNDRDTLYFRLPAPTYEQLMKIGNASEYGIYVIALTGLTYLLCKYTGNRDTIIGSPVFQQKSSSIVPNRLLPLRTQINKEMTFKELLLKVKKNVVEANQNNNYPLEDIVKQIGLDIDAWGDEAISSLFGAFVFFENIHLHNEETINYNKYETVFCFRMKKEYMACEINYNSTLYNKLTINRLFQHLVNLLNAASDNPDLKLSEIEIISPEEKKKASELNQTQKNFSRKGTIPYLYSRQARITPGNTAVIEYGETMTYKELGIESDKIARILLKSGVDSNELIALYADRTRQFVAAILGILKAGSAYVPIDPGYPQKRIQYIFQDTAARVLVTESARLESITDYIPKHVEIIVCLDNIDNINLIGLQTQGITVYSHQDIEKQIDKPLDLPQNDNEDNIAYVIYTSGSTGNPKGVVITHKAVLNTLFWLDDIFQLSIKDVVAQKTSASFTDSVWEFFWPLIVGAKLSIVDDTDVKEPRRLYKKLKEDNVTFTQFVPPLMNIFLKYLRSLDEPAPLPTLKWVFNGGEALPVTLVKDWYQQFKKAKIANIYGTTETAIYASYHLIEKTPVPHQVRIPIGRPIANASLHILDEKGRLCPINIQGEICVGGTSLTNGYWKQPSLTQQAFTWHPVTGERLYRTGDTGFLDFEGIFQYTGRSDQQVQVRGNRVELAEIVNRLLKQKNIKEAVVLPTAEDEGYTDLEAYFTSDRDISPSELKEYLLYYLPDYMIPSYFVHLDHFPLTPNGKIDRKALPFLKKSTARQKQYVPPRNHTEQNIATVWQKVLKIEKIGIHDNLFEFGANSLKVLDVLSQLSGKFEITLDDIFEHPTVAELANVIYWKKDSLKEKIHQLRKNILTGPGEQENTARTDEYLQLKKIYEKKVKEALTNDFKEKNTYELILLTGVTGYLGAHLLAELLETTSARLYLLVRGNNLEEANLRLKYKIIFYLGRDYFQKIKGRLKVVWGDITVKNLGMDETVYRKLSETIDAVVHAAANVKYFGVYKDFYKVNVMATEQLLEFSLTSKKKDFHYISTLGVGEGDIEGKNYGYFTEFSVDIGQHPANNYTRSKFEAEKKIMAYRVKGLDASIHRVGNLVFHSETGKFQENIETSSMYANLKFIISLGCVPDTPGLAFEMTYIDDAARALALLITNKNCINDTFHVTNPFILSWSQLARWLRKAGIPVKPLATNEFFDVLEENVNNSSSNPEISKSLLHSLLLRKMTIRNTKIEIDAEKTRKILEKLGFKWTRPTERSTKKMVEYCRKVGFLK